MTGPVNPSVYTAEYYQSSNYADYLERADRYKKTAYELAGLFRTISLVDRDSLIIDFGCAVGFLIEGFREVGLKNTIGVEISDWARGTAQKNGLSVHKSVDDLAINQSDLLIALDVFEHMTDQEIAKVLIKTNPRALLVRIPSSTDGGKTFALEVSRQDPTHINCKTKEQWIEFFKEFEYKTFLRLNLFTVYDTPGVTCLLIL
jgi:2-polyprenyl-3-methyl-5-hydroxy-6-metoxy-1,4-benzoquinol methylase